MSRKNTSAKPTGAEQRAMRESRRAELADPAAEAKAYEKSFLNNLANARSDYDWLISNQAWGKLGYDSLGDWYVARIEAPMRALGARPNPEVGIDLALRIYAEELNLPPMQRRSMADLATIAGISEKRFRRLVARSLPGTNDGVSDLASSSTIDGEFTEEASAGGVPADQAEPVRAGTPEHSATGVGDAAYVVEPEGDGDTSPVAVPTQDQTRIEGERPSTGGSDETAPSGVVAQPPVGVPGDEAAEDLFLPREGSSAADPLISGAPSLVADVPDPDADREQSGEGASSPDNRLDAFRAAMATARGCFVQWDAEMIAELGPDAFDLYIDVTDWIAAHRIQVLLEQPAEQGGAA